MITVCFFNTCIHLLLLFIYSVKGNELQFGVAENLQGLNASQVVYLAC